MSGWLWLLASFCKMHDLPVDTGLTRSKTTYRVSTVTSVWYIFLNNWHQCALRLTPPRPAPRRKAGDHAGAGVKTKFKFLLYPKQASVAFFFKFSWIKVALHPHNLENKFGHFSQNYSIIFVLDFHTCQGLAKAGATDPSGALASLRCSFSTPGQKKTKKRVEMFDLSKTRYLLNVDCQVFVNKNWRPTPNHMTSKPFACQIIFIFFLLFHIFSLKTHRYKRKVCLRWTQIIGRSWILPSISR